MPVMITHQVRIFLFIVFVLLINGISLTANAVENKKVTKTPEQQIEYLVNLAKQLTEQARSGDAAASSFRINVVFYRESLRDFMLEKPDPAKYSKALLMEFVRMSALLQSANWSLYRLSCNVDDAAQGPESSAY